NCSRCTRWTTPMAPSSSAHSSTTPNWHSSQRIWTQQVRQRPRMWTGNGAGEMPPERRRSPGSSALRTAEVDSTTADTTMVSDRVSDVRLYLNTVVGDTKGRLHIAVGRNGYFTPDGKYTYPDGDWTQSHYGWPAEADQAVGEIARTAAEPKADVYVC